MDGLLKNQYQGLRLTKNMHKRLIKVIESQLGMAIYYVNEISKILPDVNDPDANEYEGELLDVCLAMGVLEELRKKIQERLQK